MPFEFSKLVRWARGTAAIVVWRYGIAVAAVLAATGVRLAFNPVLGVEAPHVPFALAVIVAARFGGRGPGLVATALSALSVDWFFVWPFHAFAITSPEGLWGLTLFVGTGALISLLVGSLRELLLLRTRAGEALRASRARLEFILEAARLGAWELDVTSHTAWRSLQHDAIFGYPALLPEWTYEMFLDHVLPEDREEVDRKMRQTLARGANVQFECRIRRADGAVRWIWAQGRSQPDPEGRPVRLSGIVRDITARKQNEERLRQGQKLESIGLLAGGIAHDFNNLLTVIIGNADFALHKYPSIEEIQHIISASKRAAELTRQLLAYAGKGQFVATTFNLSDLVSRSTQLLSASLPERVELVSHLSEQELPIRADPSQIEQVLMNLVINAGEAIPSHTDGRVEITTSIREVAPETVRVHAPAFDARPGQFVCLEVTDSGAGMDEATLAQVFDPFFSTKFTGRGLGLAAVQGIVRSCGGFIEIHSSSGAGSTFQVFLPAAGKKPVAEIPAGSRQGASWGRDRGRAAILIVEDEEMVRQLASMALRSHSYEVLEAKNGKDALEVLAGAVPRPSLVLLDLTMPVMGGEELVPILKRDYPGLWIIVTSGYPEEDARRGFPPGAVAGFLQKPYTVATLTEKVEETFNSGGANAEAPTAA